MKNALIKNHFRQVPGQDNSLQTEGEQAFFGSAEAFFKKPAEENISALGAGDQAQNIYTGKAVQGSAITAVQAKAATGSAIQPALAIQRKCAACEEEENQVQKKEAETGAAPATAEATTAVAGSAGFIVADNAIPETGQMRKSVFLQRLSDATCNTVDHALAGTPYSSDNCPYIRAAFMRHQSSTPRQIEELIHRYEPSAINATSAENMIQRMQTRVSIAVTRWKQNGDLTGVPAEIAAQIPAGLRLASGMAGTIASGISSVASGIGSLFFKANEGGAKITAEPVEVMNSLGKGQSIEGGTRSKMESAFGTGFSDVEIHTDSNAAQLSKNMNARAFTVGNHIAFAGGEYQPGTLMGDALMAHELAHTVQQNQGKTNETQTKGVADYNALETDADNTAVNVMTKITGRDDVQLKNKVNRGLKTGLTISRCNSGSSPAPAPSPSPSPAPPPPAPVPPAIPPEFLVTGLPQNTAAYTNKIFFNRNLTTLEPTEDTKLTNIATNAASSAVNVDLHGSASEDETVAGLETTRVTEVERLLATKGHTGTRNPLPHPGGGAGNIDYRKARVVEIKRAGATPSTPNCIDPITGLRRDGIITCSPATQFTTAQTRSRQVLNRVITALTPGAISSATRAALTRFFGATPATMASVAASVRMNLVTLKSHVLTQMTPVSTPPSAPGGLPGPGHRCTDLCDAGCSGNTIAYNSGVDGAATMTLCPPFMRDPDVISRGDTLMHEGLHGITLPHTTAAGAPDNAHDTTYEWQRLINFLDTDTALKNNDSYILFMRQVMNPGTPVQAGQEPGHEDTFAGIAPGSVEENDAKSTIAWLDGWLENADQDVSNTYGTIEESIPAGSWSNPYYRTVMRFLSLHFGFTMPPSVPTQMEKMQVAGISNRISRLRSAVGEQLSFTKATGVATSWAAGPGTAITLGDDFFGAATRRLKLNVLINALMAAATEIPAPQKTHYAALLNELRLHAGRGAP